MMKKLKDETLYVDWKKHQAGRANTRVAIEDILQDEIGGILSKNQQDTVKQEMFQFVYQSYVTANESVFTY